MTTYRDVNHALPDLANLIMVGGERVDTKVGKTMELLMQNFTLTEPLNREVIVPGRKASLSAQIVETAWVLSGKDDIETLLPYLPRAADFSDDGEVWRAAYGPRLRAWRPINEGQCEVDCAEAPFCDHRGVTPVDQLANVVKLLQHNPSTRRAVISLWDPALDYPNPTSKDVPCNNWLSFVVRNETLHLQVAIRSNDLIWGWSGINQFEWSVLLEIVAKLTGNKVGTITYSTTSLHIYERHFTKATKLADASSDPVGGLPWVLSPRFEGLKGAGYSGVQMLDGVLIQFWELERGIRTGENPAAYLGMAEPMFRSWLQVLAFHWSRDGAHLRGLEGTPLWVAAHESPKPPKAEEVKLVPNRRLCDPLNGGNPFVDFAAKLHTEKSAVYGDSWKKRGEAMSIIPNEARKVDRLGVAGAGDSASDTVVDLLIYLIKHRLWLADKISSIPWPFPDRSNPSPTAGALLDEDLALGHVLRSLEMQYGHAAPTSDSVELIRRMFEDLVKRVDRKDSARYTVIDSMLPAVYVLARQLWAEDQEMSYRGADAD